MSDAAPIAILVEDERQIRRFVRTALETEGWHVFEAETLKHGLVEAGTRKPDVVILDLGLPDGDGVDFIRDLRTWSAIPVIVLSARVHETDKIEALDAGADDYLAKPFGVGELLARVRAVLRRKVAAGSEKLSLFRFGDVEVDLIKRVVRKRGAEVHLTAIESPNTARSLGTVVCSARALRSCAHESLASQARGRLGAAETPFDRDRSGLQACAIGR
jgi:two-component system KDP operon response regulator KdpE